MSTLKCLVAAVACACGFVSASPASETTYPTKPIRFIVPFPPGGGTDILARFIAQKLTARWHQQVLVDNRPGAQTNIGMELTARSAPDGYTMIMASLGLATNPSLYKKLPFDPLRDLLPVSLVARSPTLLTTHPSLPVKNVKQLIALAKSRPGELNYGSYGAGSSSHLAAELFQETTGIHIVHVPYRGGAPAVTALLAGEVHMLFSSVLPVLAHVKSERARPIALASTRRFAGLPGVPTFNESGVAFEMGTWFGVLVPAGTPKETVSRLHAEIARVVADPEVRNRIAADGGEPVGSTPAEFTAFVKKEMARWAKVIAAAKITAE